MARELNGLFGKIPRAARDLGLPAPARTWPGEAVMAVSARGRQYLKKLHGLDAIVIRPHPGTSGFMRPGGQAGQG